VFGVKVGLLSTRLLLGLGFRVRVLVMVRIQNYRVTFRFRI